MAERVTGAVTKTAENLGLRRAAVIGAGAMGSGIAAHLANAGIEVDLLDIIPENANDHNVNAKMGVERQLKLGGFMHPDRANSVRIGNVTDDFDRLADADWIIEVVFEDLQIKRDLYARIDGIRKSGSIISSNTSTIRLAELTADRSDSFARDFVITHFFNPPRRMKLLEIVSNNQTSSEVVARIEAINDHLLGKSNIRCFDTPGFIANRVGNFWMSVASLEAFRLGLTVEETDAVMSRPFGIPRTGIFGLFDFVGIQLVPLVWGSFMQSLPANDRHRDFDITRNQIFAIMIERGLIGRAGPGGFYRRKNAVGERVNDALDLKSMAYRPATAANFNGLTDQTNLRDFCEYDHKGAHYAFSVLSNVVTYASTIAGEVAENISDIDLAMRLGYNWKKGPFELADQVGADWIAQRLDVAGQTIPDLLRQAADNGGFYPNDSQMQRIGGGVKTRSPLAGVLTLAAIKRKSTRVAGNPAVSIWDLGDDVAGFEIHTKLNACDEDVIAMAAKAIDVVESNFCGLVIGSDNVRSFSAGAQLDTFVRLCEANDWDRLSTFVASGQLAFHNLKYANFPVVAAVGGLALGGGAELSMHADHVVAHSELAAGLPERNVGIVPGWGGVTQLLLRHQRRNPDSIKGAEAAFRTLIECQISQSALQARDMGLLRETDSIVMNRDRLLAAAKSRVIELSSDYRVPIPARVFAGGDALFEQLMEIAQRKRDSKEFTATDIEICRRAAEVISGRDRPSATDCDELAFMELERRAVLALAKQESTQARLKHMLITNTVLRN